MHIGFIISRNEKTPVGYCAFGLVFEDAAYEAYDQLGERYGQWESSVIDAVLRGKTKGSLFGRSWRFELDKNGALGRF